MLLHLQDIFSSIIFQIKVLSTYADIALQHLLLLIKQLFLGKKGYFGQHWASWNHTCKGKDGHVCLE